MAVISIAAALALILVIVATHAFRETASADLARTSWAIGLSAGAGFRGVVPLAPEPFRSGLLDGLAGGMRTTAVMERPEAYARIRDVLKRLAAAELATISARVDATEDH